MVMSIHFFSLSPLGLIIKLNINTPKVENDTLFKNIEHQNPTLSQGTYLYSPHIGVLQQLVELTWIVMRYKQLFIGKFIDLFTRKWVIPFS